MTTATANEELVNLVFTDWRNSTEAHLDGVPRNATIGEVLAEAVRVMQLPFRSAFQAVFRDRQLNNSEKEGQEELEQKELWFGKS